MGDVHAALAGQQELAADRGHGVIQVDLHAAGGQDFGRHQAGGAAADDGEARTAAPAAATSWAWRQRRAAPRSTPRARAAPRVIATYSALSSSRWRAASSSARAAVWQLGGRVSLARQAEAPRRGLLARPVDQHAHGLGPRRAGVGVEQQHDGRFEALGAVDREQPHGFGMAEGRAAHALRAEARARTHKASRTARHPAAAPRRAAPAGWPAPPRATPAGTLAA
jgi:hypothetical protein